ncbi:MAG: alpha/beta fold hydrolase [Lagierella massiliensis]|nr:alpha/beta fold hydrolase [Lagierella massiliensis]
MYKNYKVESSCGIDLDVNYYEERGDKGLIQILHGMQEHKERYDEFAKYLVERGYRVVIHDHLGHGKSISSKHPLGDMVSLYNLIEDIHIVRNKFSFDDNYICLGHSMGSFLARIYASKYPVKTLILSGTGSPSSVQSRLLKILLKFQNRKIPLENIQRLVVGPYEKHFKNPMDWLSLNRENQFSYAKDPLCGKPFTREGYEVLGDIVINLNKTDTFKKCTSDKIFLISGESDPVGDFGKGVNKVYKSYKNIDRELSLKIYQNMSHEILNEINNIEVYKDILKFLEK